MFETLLITFREGLEAFLIVAITLAYLFKTGRGHLAGGVYAGIAMALLISATTGWHVAELAENEVFEGGLAMVAGVLVASMTYVMMRGAKGISGAIHRQIDQHADRTSMIAAQIGVFIFTTLMIAREGMETALLIGAISAQDQASTAALYMGAFAGLALAFAIGYIWVKQSHKINLKLFMQVTGVFLFIFAVHLFIYGVHELSEMDMLPFGEFNYTLHIWTEPFGHGQLLAQIINYSLVVVPCAWLALASVMSSIKAKSAQNIAA